jgi:hypothetical protein
VTQDDAQPNGPASPFCTHVGVAPVQLVVQLPQVAGNPRLASQPLSALPSQSAYPGAQAVESKEQAPAVVQETVPATFGRFVQSWPHVPQFIVSLGTHTASQETWPAGHVPFPGASLPSFDSPTEPSPLEPTSVDASPPPTVDASLDVGDLKSPSRDVQATRVTAAAAIHRPETE